MGKVSFSDGLALFGIALGIVLLVLDKANKMKGAMLLVGLGISALMILPLALGNNWIANASSSMMRFSRGLFAICLVLLVYSLLAMWVSDDGTDFKSFDVASRPAPSTRLLSGTFNQRPLTAEEGQLFQPTDTQELFCSEMECGLKCVPSSQLQP